jgi:uncharacterized protein (TIGR02596 family)
MKRTFQTSTARLHAFSLVEMLVVIVIVSLILALATPALTRTLQSTRLTSTGETLLGSIAEAQQTAVGTNTAVEMRFFNFTDTSAGDQSPIIHSYQLFKVVAATVGSGGSATIQETLTPVANLVRLPEGIVIATDNSVSGAFSYNGSSISQPDTKPNSPVGYSGVQGANYFAFRFMPDGTCRTVNTNVNNMASLVYQTLQNNFFTLTYGSGTPVTLATMPKNFYTIQLDPYTGKVRTYKPGF